MERSFFLPPEAASTSAEHVDALFFTLTAVCSLVGIAIVFTIIYFCARYRRRTDRDVTPRIVGSWKLETLWSVLPFFIFLIFFAWGVRVFLFVAKPPANALEVYVVGKQWMWKLQHPEGQREINQLHVPVGQPVVLRLISQDVIHSFFIPAFRIKVDVLPDRYVTTWFQATKPGRYRLFCAEYCGTDHSRMGGEIIVMRPEEYQAWLTQHAEGSPALEGRKVFLKYQCATCHSADALARCPTLEDLYQQRVPLNDGRSVLADETYLRESILKPDAKIVAGYQPIMPSFQGQIDEEEMLQLLAFLKTLHRGGTPPRVERSPPPEIGKQENVKTETKSQMPPEEKSKPKGGAKTEAKGAAKGKAAGGTGPK